MNKGRKITKVQRWDMYNSLKKKKLSMPDNSLFMWPPKRKTTKSQLTIFKSRIQEKKKNCHHDSDLNSRIFISSSLYDSCTFNIFRTERMAKQISLNK
jgi:hypothetical protein